MTTPTVTFQQAITAMNNQQLRALVLAALANAGSQVGGAPSSSPDRGIVEAFSAFMAMEQALRAGLALSVSATTILQAGGDGSFVDAASSWYQVASNQAPTQFTPNGAAGGTGRLVATYALWAVQLGSAPATWPLTLNPGQQVQIQAADSARSIFNFLCAAGTGTGGAPSGPFGGPVTINANNPWGLFIARKPGVTSGNVTPTNVKQAKVITGPAGLFVYGSSTPVLVTSARDPETSAQLLVRCYGRWGTLAAGWTRLAFDYLIPSFNPNATRWSVDDANPYGPGSIGISMADTSGPSSTSECAAVLAGLSSLSVKPMGSGPIVVNPATTVVLTILATIATDGSNSSLVTQAAAALTALQNAIMGPVVLHQELLSTILMGGALQSVDMPTGTGGTTTITLAACQPWQPTSYTASSTVSYQGTVYQTPNGGVSTVPPAIGTGSDGVQWIAGSSASVIPGFPGASYIASLVTSPSIGSGLALATGQIFAFTLDLSTQTP
jgi:hypothetical protein